VLLRPCELCTWVELQKRKRACQPSNHPPEALRSPRLVILGVDCAGTYQGSQYARRVQMHGPEAVLQEVLKAVDPHQLESLPLRTACRLCTGPAPCAADLTIGAIGVASQRSLLVIARDEGVDDLLRLPEATDRMATQAEVALREAALQAIQEGRLRQWEARKAASAQYPGDFARLVASFTRCTLCADCLDACPLYHGELSSLLGVGSDHQPKRPVLSELVEVSRWLVSCSGCGMCEEACGCGIPLALLVLTFSQLIREELRYAVGDPLCPLPWCSAGS
jgi:formate dehydrogenase subunit beta